MACSRPSRGAAARARGAAAAGRGARLPGPKPDARGGTTRAAAAAAARRRRGPPAAPRPRRRGAASRRGRKGRFVEQVADAASKEVERARRGGTAASENRGGYQGSG